MKKIRIKWKNIFLFLFIIICITTLTISCVNLIKSTLDSKKTDKQIENIENETEVETISDENVQIIEQEEKIDKENPYWEYIKMPLIDVDFAKLKQTNSNTVGWIKVEGTNINYPFVQANDNNFYLTHSYDKSYNTAGWVFLDYRNNIKRADKNTIIYAHGRLDKTMFGSLRNYKDQTYWGYHPFVYIYDDNGGHRYEIFSAYEADVTSNTYLVGFKDETEKQDFLDECVKQSVIQTNVVPTLNDRILTLSTCTNTGGYATRWVVQARLKGME